MKFVIFALVFFLVWRWWTSATPLPCTETNCSTKLHPCNHPAANLHRTKRDILKTVAGALKNATTYVGKALHIIRKRDANETKKVKPQKELTQLDSTGDVIEKGNGIEEVIGLELDKLQVATNKSIINEETKKVDILLVDKVNNITERLNKNGTTVINIRKDKREISNATTYQPVQPCRKKRSLDDPYISETCEQHLLNEKSKNITIIIQNLKENERRKREATLNLNKTVTKSDEAAKNYSDHQHHISKREEGVNETEESKNVLDGSQPLTVEGINKDEPLLGKKLLGYFEEMDGTISAENFEENSAEHEATATSQIAKTILRPIRINGMKYGVETEESKNVLDGTQPLTVEGINKDEPMLGRKLLGYFDEMDGTISEENFEKNSEEHEATATSQIAKTILRPIRIKQKEDTFTHLRCTCAIFVDSPKPGGNAPYITECYLEHSDIDDPKVLCSRTCLGSSKVYFGLDKAILCTHINNVYHYPILDHPDFLDKPSETIICQMVPDEIESPLKHLTTWLNVVLLDIAVCLTGLSIICMYLVCFVTWKRRRLIPIYTAASLTVK